MQLQEASQKIQNGPGLSDRSYSSGRCNHATAHLGSATKHVSVIESSVQAHYLTGGNTGSVYLYSDFDVGVGFGLSARGCGMSWVRPSSHPRVECDLA